MPDDIIDVTTYTKRTYLGVGYIHVFKNDKTGEVINVPCTQEDNDALGQPNATIPTLADHTWLKTVGGGYKVDTPDTTLGENEYFIKDGLFFIGREDIKIEEKTVEKVVAPQEALSEALAQIEVC
jgi:hypothetical protein